MAYWVERVLTELTGAGERIIEREEERERDENVKAKDVPRSYNVPQVKLSAFLLLCLAPSRHQSPHPWRIVLFA